MSITSLQRIRAEVERRVNEELVSALLDHAISRHTRKGHLDKDCDCSFCEAKRKATFDLGIGLSPHLPRLQYFGEGKENMRDWKARCRDDKLREIRRVLKKLKSAL